VDLLQILSPHTIALVRACVFPVCHPCSDRSVHCPRQSFLHFLVFNPSPAIFALPVFNHTSHPIPVSTCPQYANLHRLDPAILHRPSPSCQCRRRRPNVC